MTAVVTEAGVDTWRAVCRTSFSVDEEVWSRSRRALPTVGA
jgi:hypothetical protein